MTGPRVESTGRPPPDTLSTMLRTPGARPLAAPTMPYMTLLALALICTGVAAPGPGTWFWPLRPAPEIIRVFSPPAIPWGPGHRGIDLAARPGQPVYAAGTGRIAYAGRIAGRGVIAIAHGALRTTYLPVHPSVRRGQAVTAGTRIGVLQNAPGHCGLRHCLHWGLRRDLVYLDPLGLVRPRVRLLPHWHTHTSSQAHGPNLPAPPPHGTIGTQSPYPPNSSRTTSPAGTNPNSGPADAIPASYATHLAQTAGGARAADAAGGALVGMALAFALSFARRRIPGRRKPPPGVIDLAHERKRRRQPDLHHKGDPDGHPA